MYVVEFFGYNCGEAVQVYESENLEDAKDALNASRVCRPKVSHRLIQVLEKHAPKSV